MMSKILFHFMSYEIFLQQIAFMFPCVRFLCKLINDPIQLIHINCSILIAFPLLLIFYGSN